MEGRLNYMLERMKSLNVEKDKEKDKEKDEETDEEEAEKEREDEDRYYENKRKALKKERDDEDQALFLVHELQKEEIAKISKDNKAEREREDKLLYHFSLREEKRREDERNSMFKQLQTNREVREQERIRESARNKEDRRDRIRDRQHEADRNLLRDKDRLSAQTNAYLTYMEGQLDMMDAKGRLVDKNIEYIEERKSERESIRQVDRDMIDYLSEWQKEDPARRRFDYELTRMPEREPNKSLKDS